MQETTNWQDDAALGRFQMISPLLDPEMDNAKRIQLRQRIAENNGLSAFEDLRDKQERVVVSELDVII